MKMMSMLCIVLALLLAHQSDAALRRSPRVYNALITTDQNITPSRSYPVIQPHIEYPAFAPPWPAYNPYSYHNFYNPGAYHGYQPFGHSLDQQIAYGDALDAAARAANNQHRRINNNNKSPNNKESADARSKGSPDQSEDKSPSENNPAANDRSDAQGSKAPIGGVGQNPPEVPLNAFGLPPSLVPINPLYNGGWNYHGHQGNLNPYPYNSFPLIYDQINPYQPHEFLPPYGFYSPELYPHGVPGFAAGNGDHHDDGSSGSNAGRQGGDIDESSADGKNTGGDQESGDQPDNKSGASGSSAESTPHDQDNKDEGQLGQNSKDVETIDTTGSGSKGQTGDEVMSSIKMAQIRNYVPMNHHIRDVPPPPLPRGANVQSN